MCNLVQESGPWTTYQSPDTTWNSLGELLTTGHKKGVIFLIAPFLQIFRVFRVWKVLLRVISREEKRAKPNGFVIVVVFGDRCVGDCIATKPCSSKHFGVFFDMLCFTFCLSFKGKRKVTARQENGRWSLTSPFHHYISLIHLLLECN